MAWHVSKLISGGISKSIIIGGGINGAVWRKQWRIIESGIMRNGEKRGMAALENNGINIMEAKISGIESENGVMAAAAKSETMAWRKWQRNQCENNGNGMK